MLKQRIATAAVLVPLVVAAVMLLPHAAFAALCGLLVLIGALEWAGLSGLPTRLTRNAYLAIVAALLSILWVLLGLFTGVVAAVLMIALLWWLVALALVVRYEQRGTLTIKRGLKLTAGLLVLIPTWIGLVALRADPQFGPPMVIFLLILIWSADSAAYFAGMRWGKNRLAPAVSPGKSWEGVGGALVAVICVAVGWSLYRDFAALQTVLFVGVAMVITMVSILGDLTESLFKRLAGAKDSGTIFPGHGGVLDRIDSLTAAAPLFLLSLSLLQWLQ